MGRIVPRHRRAMTAAIAVVVALVLGGGAATGAGTPLPDVVQATEIFSASFDSGTDGFSYVDDAFLDTNQPSYASGARQASGGYGGSGGLRVTLGGVNGDDITNMSGGWERSFTLSSAASGVLLSYRYRLTQEAPYEYDEYSRVYVDVDGTLHGRGAQQHVDHIGGDGQSSQGRANTYDPTTGWQRHEVFLGDLSAGSHTVTIGGFNNQKTTSDEITYIDIDDVALTSGNTAPADSDVETILDRITLAEYKADIEDLADFGDRCMMTGCNLSSWQNAQEWVEDELAAVGYTVQRHTYTYDGTQRSNLYVTKVGSENPDEMYMVGAHLDGRGGGGAADDDGSGIALMTVCARELAAADVETDTSIRFLFWGNEESGLQGSSAYRSDRYSLQGVESPSGSGLYPEPTWLGLIQHDMLLYDHGVGSPGSSQSPYADLDVEYRYGTDKAAESRALAEAWHYAVGTYAQDYPAGIYDYSTNTDDAPFHDYVASISIRENRRSLTSGGSAEWINPYYHTSGDVFANYDDEDFLLGLNAVQATCGLVAELAGARLVSANEPPTADAKSATTAEDVSTEITLSGSDPDGDPLTFAVATHPSHGTVTVAGATATYAPDADWHGGDSFTYVAHDGTESSSPATVSVTVTPVNDAPTASGGTVVTDEDVAAAVALSAVDVDGDPLTYTIVAGPDHGVLSGTAPDLTYTPAADYFGPDAFTFKASDGSLASDTVAVEIAVAAVNDAPAADPKEAATDEDADVVVTLSGTDVEGDALSFSIDGAPEHGTVSLVGTSATYAPDPDFHGQDAFAYVANDGSADSEPATVSVTVAAVNDAPVAQDLSVGTQEGTALEIVLTGSDVDGDPLTFAVTDQPAHGDLTGTPPSLLYTPDTGYIGPDAFAFEVSDGQGGSDEGTVSITVNEVNDPPVASDQSETTAEDAAIVFDLDVSDPDGDPLTISVDAGPDHGAVSVLGTSVTYTPAADYHGPDAFTYTAWDGQAQDGATVSIAVTPVNDAPVAQPASASTDEDASADIQLVATDVDGDDLTYAIAAQPAHGVVTLEGSVATYVPDDDYFGSDAFAFRVNDGTVNSADAEVTIAIASVNDAPAMADGEATVAEDGSVEIVLVGTDVEGDALTFSIVSPPEHGSAQMASPTVTYVPDADYNGTDAFTVRAHDGQAFSEAATIAVAVSAVNDAPVAGSQSVTTDQDTAVDLTLTGTDVDGDALTYAVADSPAHGTLSGTAPNLTYTPETGYVGSDAFTFTAHDGTTSSSPATVSITVNAAVSGPVFEDDFETDLGWTTDPNDTDTATTGQWERGNPEGTSSSGPKQLGDTVSGSNDLVTGRLAGSSVGSYDIDGGVTSIQSPQIELTTGYDLRLSFSYYLAHLSNATSADFLRVKVVGTTTETVFEEVGAGDDDDAVWDEHSVDISGFAGQTVRLLVEAADANGGSLVEAAIDDVRIEALEPATTLLAADFDESAESFAYGDDAFRGTSAASYASGTRISSGGYSGGALQVDLGGIDNSTVNGMSGGWSRSFTLSESMDVTVQFHQQLTLSADYESDEYGETLVAVGGTLHGTGGNDYVARLSGDGNGGSAMSTGWQSVRLEIGVLPAGQHTLVLGGHNNKKTYSNEFTEIRIDEVVVEGRSVPPETTILEADFDDSAESFSYDDDTFRGTSAPGYAAGERVATGGYSGGALKVDLGAIDGSTVYGMSGGWSRSFTLSEAMDVVVRFHHRLTIASEYESDEYGEALVSVDGTLYGLGGDDYVARLVGDGNGGSAMSTGWTQVEIDVGTLAAGQHTLVVGGHNNKKTYSDEWVEAMFDELAVVGR